MLKINNQSLPKNPSSYFVGIMDISNAGRLADGYLMIERVATKQKIELMWYYLTPQELSNLLTMVSPVSFEIEFIDPQTSALKRGEFYCGDRSAEAIDYHNGEIRYKNIKFNLIER